MSKYSEESIRLDKAPLGTIGISEMDYDNQIPNPTVYIVGSKSSCGMIEVVKINGVSRKEERMIGGFKICPREG